MSLLPKTETVDHPNEVCPHCGGACFPKLKRMRIFMKEKWYFYQYYWFECSTCYYCSPRSKRSIEEAREFFRERV